ncbi:hypothetical protein F5J12DRAFT_782330 [Pisolithus orientalis]|uniref:uncharacterized protein n=1 Tax=Pisolithus orientalis TaxID=936130 RepID=UPI002224E30A|nr:uncharacterized protein F5J12DRAFT_782330 [Pisolithus orientalis]KAI6008928.1 hypothetical protein F5J12DRAFT_782330 [Pisolithus orientalis]
MHLQEDLDDQDDKIHHLQDKVNKLLGVCCSGPASVSDEQEAHDLKWGVQAEPADVSGQRKLSVQQDGPTHPPLEDVVMVNHAADFLDIDNIHMTVDEGVPSAQVQETLFPEFTGTENPYWVLYLGEGFNPRRGPILFVRVNNNLYAYEGEKVESIQCNLTLAIVPPVPVDAICQLYVKVSKEPEGKAPNVRKAQDLITFFNLWKRCRMGLNRAIDLALSKWKPPAWSSKKSCKKREALEGKGQADRMEEGQASRAGVPPPVPGPFGGHPALQEQLADAPVTPAWASEVGSTALVDHITPVKTQPALGQCPGLSFTKGAKPKGVPELPPNAPSLNNSVESWREFINKEQRHSYWGRDNESKLMSMLPGVLSAPSRPDDSEAEWAHQAAREYVGCIMASGGDNNPQALAKIKPLRKALDKPCPEGDTGSKECRGYAVSQLLTDHLPLWVDNLQVISTFAMVVFMYDLPHCPCGGVSASRGNSPMKDAEIKEGEMMEDLFKKENRSWM